MIYFDNSATTFPKPESVYKVIDTISRNAFNAGRGTYTVSKKYTNLINETRQEIGSFIGADAKKVVFTSSATEAMNVIINGISLNKDDYVYVSPFEHNSVIRTLYATNANIVEIPFDKITWEVEIESLKNMFALKKPRAVFITQISNVTGFEPDYQSVFELAAKYDSTNVLDAAQGYGIVEINTNNVDYIVFAGHKSLYGSFGVGGFIKLTAKELKPFMFGGTGSDSLNPKMPNSCPEMYEAGSHNIIAIAALNEGAKWIKKQNAFEHEKELTNYFINSIKNNNKIKLFLPLDKSTTGIISLAVEGYSSDEVASILDGEFDIQVRSGYHCAPFVHDFIGSKKYNGTVRVSIGVFNTKNEINKLINALNTL